MIVTCQTCGTNENLEKRYVAGRTALVRCTVCSGLMVAETLHAETRGWWTVIANTVCGPFTARELKVLIEHGEVHWKSYLWTYDMHGWEVVTDSPRLAFARAWIRELELPILEPIVGKLVEAPKADETDGADDKPDDGAYVRLFKSRSPVLQEAGIYAAAAALTLTLMGGGFLAGIGGGFVA
jgi:hypothetical protein